MFGPPGRLYVYFSYGMHWCANVVCQPDGTAGAVLLRAGEVIDGVELARRRRPSARADHDLARGPARLTKALGLSGTDDGADLLDLTSRSQLYAADGVPGVPEVLSGPRVGVSVATELPWRFWVAAAPSVSPFRAGRPRLSHHS
jgi:DNA-3-methyladenine glycosylase